VKTICFTDGTQSLEIPECPTKLCTEENFCVSLHMGVATFSNRARIAQSIQ
jgi:hypothetical protein